MGVNQIVIRLAFRMRRHEGGRLQTLFDAALDQSRSAMGILLRQFPVEHCGTVKPALRPERVARDFPAAQPTQAAVEPSRVGARDCAASR